MRTLLALLSGACLVLSGCPLAMEDAYITGGDPSGGNDAAVHEADSEPSDSDASTDVQAEVSTDVQVELSTDVQADLQIDVPTDLQIDVPADAGDMDAAEATEVETAPACGKPCGKQCEELCDPGEPCESNKDCAGDAECKKNDLDVRVCELDD